MAGLHLGTALVVMATLMLEILLVRIFSVTTWYHFSRCNLFSRSRYTTGARGSPVW